MPMQMPAPPPRRPRARARVRPRPRPTRARARVRARPARRPPSKPKVGGCSLPDLHHELGLQLLLVVLDLQLDVLRIGRLVEPDGRAALVVALVRPLAGEEGHDLVRPRLEVAEV